MDLSWLSWAQKLQAIAQTGLTYSQNHYDVERYEIIRSIAAEMVSTQTGAEIEQVEKVFTEQEGYATPKIDVRGAVFDGNKILLVHERQDNLWTLPGGWADVGESPSEAVEREILEESGFRSRAVRLLALYDAAKHPHPPMPFHVYKLFFLCEIIGGQPKDSLETEGASFFGKDSLPDLSPARVSPEQIKRLFELHNHPELPTDFD